MKYVMTSCIVKKNGIFMCDVLFVSALKKLVCIKSMNLHISKKWSPNKNNSEP